MSRRTNSHAKWRPRLPLSALRGDFFITEEAVEAAEQLLPTYRGPDGDHEGIVLLAGREQADITVITTALAPTADHGRGHVICDESSVAAASRAARAVGLGILGQLHSHGRDATEHSKGDDELIVMPFEGMLSLIAPWYGRVGLRPLCGLGVHQYQDGGWVLIRPETVRMRLKVLPNRIDLR